MLETPILPQATPAHDHERGSIDQDYRCQGSEQPVEHEPRLKAPIRRIMAKIRTASRNMGEQSMSGRTHGNVHEDSV